MEVMTIRRARYRIRHTRRLAESRPIPPSVPMPVQMPGGRGMSVAGGMRGTPLPSSASKLSIDPVALALVAAPPGRACSDCAGNVTAAPALTVSFMTDMNEVTGAVPESSAIDSSLDFAAALE